MKRTLTIIAFALGSTAVFAQQDPQFSQYMHNKMFMNPAYAGMRQALCGTMFYRNQWLGFDGAPKTLTLSIDAFVPQIRGGVGLNIMSDELGFERTQAYRLSYAFHLPVGGGTLGIGIEGGAATKALGPTGGGQWIATTNWQNDPSIPPQMKVTTFDIGFGLWYQRQNMWFGLSSTHLAANTFDDGQSSPIGTPIPVAHDLIYQMARHYWVTGGITLMQGNTWEVRPSFLVKSDATVTSFDITCLAMFNQKFWFGASYRFKDAIMPMVGFQMPHPVLGENGGLKVGVAYDYTLSNLGDYNNGTIEVFLNYCYPLKFPHKTERHGDVRLFE